MERWVEALWYGRSPWSMACAVLLLPLAAAYGLVTAGRRWAYRSGVFRVQRLTVPVILVGNLTAGGTGKTPVVGWLVRLCLRAGLKPGIVSRGYGSRPSPEPRLVNADDDAADVGDEPLLLCRQTGVPVCVHADRVAAGRRLLAEGVNVIIGDDGLQHYRLHRNVEIAVVDGERRLGNGWLLPAGPLRESAARLRTVNIVLVNGGPAGEGEHELKYRISSLQSLAGDRQVPLGSFRGQRVRVIAGIGNPARFHAQLAAAGLDIEIIPVPDHGRVDLEAMAANGTAPIVMTEKDAVKYRPVSGCDVWVAILVVEVPPAVGAQLLGRLQAPVSQRETGTA